MPAGKGPWASPDYSLLLRPSPPSPRPAAAASVEMTTAVPPRSLFIGVDVGTGSARAGIFDEQGRLLSTASSPIQIWKDGDCVEVAFPSVFRL